jgi:hypothetical protein
MRSPFRIVKIFAVSGLACAVVATASGANAAAAAARRWGKALQVPGTATLNIGGSAGMGTVSCASAGNCSAGGSYKDGSGHLQAFVANQVNGTWRKAVEVPGTAALNAGGSASVASVSCPTAGSCSAGGAYTDGSGHLQPFVVSKKKGTWRTAIDVPGSATLNANGNASILSVSCASAGNCAAGGFYLDGSGKFQAFVVNQVNGTWHKAIEVPGTATLNADGNASTQSVSCASAGNCVAGGYYDDGSNRFQAFVVGRVNGTWLKAIEVPGTAALNADGNASVNSVSCASAGNCAAGGYYVDGSDHSHPFVVNQVRSTWHKAIVVPGTVTLSKGALAQVHVVSCASAGSCAAAGVYTDGSGHLQAFVVSQVSGTWRKAIEVPGTSTLNKGGEAFMPGLSCSSAGNCSGGGAYTDGSGHQQAFVVSQVKGTWRTAIEVPGTATLNMGGTASTESVSCTSPGECSAAGYYTGGSGHMQALVVTES